MITYLKLTNFKGFGEAEFPFGPLTVIFGANASGKSNIGDALRFLHGISRGYTLAEIAVGKYVGGALAWAGIRGGPQALCFQGAGRFAIEVGLRLGVDEIGDAVYRIEIAVGPDGDMRVAAERLSDGSGDYVYDSAPPQAPPKQDAHDHVKVKMRNPGKGRRTMYEYIDQRPVLGQVLQDPDVGTKSVVEISRRVMSELERLRFPQFDVAAMRESAFPSQPLGEHGEGLPAALSRLYGQPEIQSAMDAWLGQLTPMDAVRLNFPVDATGKVGLQLVEADERKTNIGSASDGTLLFLGLLAALFSEDPGSIVFLEEPENGIHPARLSLLLMLIEQRVRKRSLQIVATSHSPTLFALLPEKTRKDALVVYRLKDQANCSVRRAVDFPGSLKLFESQGAARLLASRWFENVAEFEMDKAGNE